VILLFTLAGCTNSKYSALKQAPLALNDSDLTRLISNLELDPRLDLPVHLVIEERNNAVMILQICQSRYSSRSDFTRKLTHAGREIFVFDLSEKEDRDKVLYFNQDVPTWRFVIYQYMKTVRYFMMDEIEFQESN
jgi:hypothetical protein